MVFHNAVLILGCHPVMPPGAASKHGAGTEQVHRGRLNIGSISVAHEVMCD